MSIVPPTKKQFMPTSFANSGSKVSLAQSALTGYEDAVRSTGMRIRESISKGHQIVKPHSSLQYTKSLPSFGQSPSLQTSVIMINNAIFQYDRRENELRPFGSVSDLNSSSSSELDTLRLLRYNKEDFNNIQVARKRDQFNTNDVFEESNVNFGYDSGSKKRALELDAVTENCEMELDDTDAEDGKRAHSSYCSNKIFFK